MAADSDEVGTVVLGSDVVDGVDGVGSGVSVIRRCGWPEPCSVPDGPGVGPSDRPAPGACRVTAVPVPGLGTADGEDAVPVVDAGREASRVRSRSRRASSRAAREASR